MDPDEARQTVAKMIENTNLGSFSPNCIFNMDETGLDWRLIFKKGFVVGEPKRIKVSMERVTALVGTNLTGTIKLPLL